MSNHPDHVKRQIPKMVNERLNCLSKTKEDFESIKRNYQEALERSSYKFQLNYLEKTNNRDKKKRRRKIIYFQPPFSLSVKTPLGRKFLQLVKKHFHPKHPLYKILNPKCLKISYCCLPNVKREITSINNAVRSRQVDDKNKEWCNCRGRKKDQTICPLNGYCQKASIIYKAEISSNGK